MRLFSGTFFLLTCAISLATPDQGMRGSALAQSPAESQARAGFPYLELVESFPVETDLDNAGIRNTREVWLEMIGSARNSLDFAMFYVSNQEGGTLEEVVRAVEAAADRGVSVRFLSENNFYETYPATLDRLRARQGIDVKLMKTGETMGGVLHAKYFVVDRKELFLGSQNFDWRALEHIQELGVRIDDPELAGALTAIFEMDFEEKAVPASGEKPGGDIGGERSWIEAGDTVRVRLVASPRGFLPGEGMWDLPRILELIDGASEQVELQLLTYNPVGRDRRYFADLDSALRRAAARGVQVRLLLSNWCKRAYIIPYLKSLTVLPNLEVRLVTIPEHSGGFIPYARVVHAKYMTVDGRASWIGTGNWEKGYFYSSRNVGVVVQSRKIAAILRAFFGKGWKSEYAAEIDPAAEYEPPRIGR